MVSHSAVHAHAVKRLRLPLSRGDPRLSNPPKRALFHRSGRSGRVVVEVSHWEVRMRRRRASSAPGCGGNVGQSRSMRTVWTVPVKALSSAG